jgi:DNA invertase Pin-like site-specific DNA recombinase
MTALSSPKTIGYARVSSDDQAEHGQVDALRRAGADEVEVEQASGVGERPRLKALLARLTAGDTLPA